MDYIVVIFSLATLAVLVGGVVLMAMGNKANTKYSNKLMVARVTLQGLVIVLLGLMFLLR